jgi:hypothetical protein
MPPNLSMQFYEIPIVDAYKPVISRRRWSLPVEMSRQHIDFESEVEMDKICPPVDSSKVHPEFSLHPLRRP